MALYGKGNSLGTYGLLAGAAIVGAGVALLFAPKSGEKTRADIARAGRNARRRVEALSSEFSDKVDGVIRTMESTAREIVDKGKDLTSVTSRKVRNSIHDTREAVGRLVS